MVSFFVGHKPGVGAVMKVNKYDDDWPLDVPNDAHDRFYFNSEASNLSYVFSHFQTPKALNKANYPGGEGNQARPYGLQTGSLGDQWVMWSTQSRYQSNVTNMYYMYGCVGRMSDLENMIPFADCKFVRQTDGRTRVLLSRGPISTGTAYDSVTNNSMTTYASSSSGIQSAFGYEGWAIRPTTSFSSSSSFIALDQETVSCMIWDLPCNNVPVPNPRGTPVSGQIMFEASPARVKLARPGFSIDTASGRQLIMDSDRTPIKAVMMGETPAIQPGSSYFVAKPSSIDFDLSPSMICDTICNMNGWGYSIPPVDMQTALGTRETKAYYIVQPNGILFEVEGRYPVSFKFMLYATGNEPYSTGGSAVIRKVEGKYLQIKRPGSSDVAPGYNDILLDTRFSAVTVLQEGYIPASRFTASASVGWEYGDLGYRVNFDGQGLFVFPKVIYDFGSFYTNGTHSAFVHPGSGVRDTLRDAAATVVRNDHIIMHINPNRYHPPNYTPPNPVGARYFILGAATL